MTTIVTRAGKGSPLTHTEVDTNFTNLNTAKLEAGAIALGSAGTPSISFVSDTNTGIFSPGADQLAISTNGTSRLHITSGGLVGIGTASPSAFTPGNLVVEAATTAGITISDSTGGGTASIAFSATPSFQNKAKINCTVSSASLEFSTAAAERMRIDSSGRLLVGTSTNLINTDSVQIATDSTNCLGLLSGRADAFGPRLDFCKSRGTTISPGNVSNNDQLANLLFSGYHGGYLSGAKIEAYVDGTPGANNMPGRLVFSTTADGAATPTEAMRINSSRQALIGTTSASFGCLSVFDNALSSPTQQAIIYARSTQSGDAGLPGLYIAKFANNTTTSQVLVKFAHNNGTQGQGQINANGASEAAFGTFSDHRLKENIVELPSQLENLCSLRPVEFDFKDGSGHQIGFIAQDMQAVYPDAVAEGENEMLTITGWGKTQARIVKALQEAVVKIESLEARLTAAGID